MKKTILIIVLIVLAVGISTTAFFMLTPPLEDLTAYEDIGDFDGADAEPVTNDTVKDSVKEALYEQYGLNKPLFEQYLIYMKKK